MLTEFRRKAIKQFCNNNCHHNVSEDNSHLDMTPDQKIRMSCGQKFCQLLVPTGAHQNVENIIFIKLGILIKSFWLRVN